MKKQLEKLKVFKVGLALFSFLALRHFSGLVKGLTNFSAWLNIKLNKPKAAKSPKELAERWVDLMPPDGRDLFTIDTIEDETAFVRIHLQCPLRDTGNVKACYELMNYDRVLMDQVGGNLVVLESQSNSGKPYCKLAIRKKDLPIDDLIPAYS